MLLVFQASFLTALRNVSAHLAGSYGQRHTVWYLARCIDVSVTTRCYENLFREFKITFFVSNQIVIYSALSFGVQCDYVNNNSSTSIWFENILFTLKFALQCWWQTANAKSNTNRLHRCFWDFILYVILHHPSPTPSFHFWCRCFVWCYI